MRVLDFCQVLAGSYATTILADLGAEVIKIEPPEKGDPLRRVGPIINGQSSFFILTNRNKKSLCIDLKSMKVLN
ncbi:MAG: CoA transferase [Bacteroidia bacterium]|nr:CoA transferase [Bacteroidia bacterium]